MVSTKLKLIMFDLNVRDIQEHSFTVVVAVVRRCFFKIGVLKIFVIFTGKHLW